MPIDSLLQTVETLQQRIAQHGDFLKGYETRTRYALIDPLLAALGWDVFDPSAVAPEFVIPNAKERADYALLGKDGKPKVIVEVKTLSLPLDEATKQALGYCTDNAYKFFAVTDGSIWRLYETLRAVPTQDKIVTEFDLQRSTAADISLKALALWRPAVMASSIQEGQKSIVDTGNGEETKPRPCPKPPPPPPNGDWLPLSAYSPTTGEAKPVEMRLPDGQTRPILKWNHILLEPIKWLISKNYLTAAKCPIRPGGGKSIRVNTSPTNANGGQFQSPLKIGSLFVNKHGNAQAQVKASVGVIAATGQDPSQFLVRFTKAS